MKKLIHKNLLDNKKFIIVLSVLIAIVAWVVISVTVNPDQSVTIDNIPVSIPLDNSAAEKNGLDVISGKNQTVSILVRGKRYKVGALKPDSFTAVADVSNVNAAGEYTLNVSVTKKNDDADYEIVSTTPETIKVRFDHVVSKEFILDAQADGIKATEGYVLDDIYSVQEKVTISGPQSDVNQIVRAVVVSDRSEAINQSTTMEGELVLYDAEGKRLDFEYITSEPQKFQLTVSILQYKTIPLTVKFNSIPDGLTEDSVQYTISPSSIQVMGSGDAIKNVTEINLAFIDFWKIDVGTSMTLPIQLPAGLSGVEDGASATVKFLTDSYVSKTITVNSVQIVNPPEGYQVSVDNQRYNVKMVGPKSVIDQLDAQDVVASVDLSETIVSEGKFTVPIKITVPGQTGPCWAVGEYKALLNARAKS